MLEHIVCNVAAFFLMLFSMCKGAAVTTSRLTLLLHVSVCFGVQESEGGLYVCMNTFLGFGREHVERHYRKTGQSVYMHLKRHVKEVRFPPDPRSDLYQATYHDSFSLKS